MTEKLRIEIYREKKADDFTKALATADSRLEAGSAAAVSAAMSAAFLLRASAHAVENAENKDRLDYIRRNAEILRSYMVNLIDEDVKCRGPLRRAFKENDAIKIEACRMPAIAISEEIECMMQKCLELLEELQPMCPVNAQQYIGTSAELAIGAVRCVMPYIMDMTSHLTDEINQYVTRKENIVCNEQCEALYTKLHEAVMASLK